MMLKAVAALLVFLWKWINGQAGPAPVVSGMVEWKEDLDGFYEKVLNENTYVVSSSPERPVVVTYHSRKDNSLLGLVIRWPNRNFYYVVEHK